MNPTNKKSPKAQHIPPVLKHQAVPNHRFRPALAQLKSAVSSQRTKQPVAPSIYRPQPVPKVLQKKSYSSASPQAATRQPIAPPVYRPQSLPKVLQTKRASSQSTHTGQAPRQPIAPPVYRAQPQRDKTVQCMEQNRPSSLEHVLGTGEVAESVFSSLEVEDISNLAITSKTLLQIYEREVHRTIPRLKPRQSPGTYEFVELGAGPMCSAVALWASFNSGVFTEYRSLDQLFENYGVLVGLQFLKLWKEKCKNGTSPNNAVLLGVDATCLVKAPCQLKTAILRFTNPNIGNQDLASAINTQLVPAIKKLDEHENELWVRSGRQLFKLRLPYPLIQWLQTSPESQQYKLFGLMKQTAWVIAVYRNIDLLGRFFANACEWLEKEGEVQLVVLQDYIKQWNIIELAERVGWKCVKMEPIELGFKHMQTQEARTVARTGKGGKKEKVPQNVLLTFKPIGLVKHLQEIIEFISQLKVDSQAAHLVIGVRDSGTAVDGTVIVMGHAWD